MVKEKGSMTVEEASKRLAEAHSRRFTMVAINEYERETPASKAAPPSFALVRRCLRYLRGGKPE